MAELTFYGHACFSWEENGKNVIFDPWLSENPVANTDYENVAPDAILVTHGHFDHLGDAVEISKKTGAPIIGTVELVSYCERQGAKGHGLQIGGGHQFSFGWVKMTPAWHGSAILSPEGNEYTGMPGGFLVKIADKLIYHAGDTGLFGDMKLLGELYDIDIAMLPIGDNFVMSPDDAVIAAKFLKAKAVVPMHYNTFDLIKQDPVKFKNDVENKNYAQVEVLNPGESYQI